MRLNADLINGGCLPPEFFHTGETDHTFNVLHPTLCRSSTGSLRCGCLGKRGNGCLRQIPTLCGRRVEPKRPWGVEGVLVSRGGE